MHDDASTLSSNFHASRNSFSLDAVGKVTGNNSQMQVRDERDGLRERKSEEKESKEANCSWARGSHLCFRRCTRGSVEYASTTRADLMRSATDGRASWKRGSTVPCPANTLSISMKYVSILPACTRLVVYIMPAPRMNVYVTISSTYRGMTFAETRVECTLSLSLSLSLGSLVYRTEGLA